MNRHLFKKIFLLFFSLSFLVIFSIFSAPNTLASSTGPTMCADLANGNRWQCVYPSFTSGTIPCTTWDGHYGYYNWKEGALCPSDDSNKTQCAVCEASGANDYTGSKLYGQAELQNASGDTGTPTNPTPTVYLGNSLVSGPGGPCGIGGYSCAGGLVCGSQGVSGGVCVTATNNANPTITPSTQTDRVGGKVTIQQDTNSNTTSSCNGIEVFGVCLGGSSSSNGLKGATITIDSNITVTTNSYGQFDKSVPHVDTHTVTLAVPEGYQLVSPESATQTFGTTGTTWKTDLRNVNFTVEKLSTAISPTISLSPTTPALSCDPNGDGKTDTKDLTIIENQWYGTDTGKSGDCNKDGVVNGLDFQLWKDISVVKLNTTTLY